MLETYYERRPDDGLLHGYQAMKCASLLRETMGRMGMEIDIPIAAGEAANWWALLETLRLVIAGLVPMIQGNKINDL